MRCLQFYLLFLFLNVFNNCNYIFFRVPTKKEVDHYKVHDVIKGTSGFSSCLARLNSSKTLFVNNRRKYYGKSVDIYYFGIVRIVIDQ